MIQKNPHNLHNLIHIIHIIFIIQSAFNLLQPTSAKILVFSFAMFKFILQIYWNTCPQSVRNAFTMWLPLTHSCNMNKPTIDFHRLKRAQSATLPQHIGFPMDCTKCKPRTKHFRNGNEKLFPLLWRFRFLRPNDIHNFRDGTLSGFAFLSHLMNFLLFLLCVISLRNDIGTF